METYRDYDTERAREHMKNVLAMKQHAYSSNTRKEMENIESAIKGDITFKELQNHYNTLQNMVEEDYYLNRNSSLQTLLQTPLESFQKDMQRQKDRDIIKEHFDITFLPNIVLYKENAIAKKDLKVEPSKINKSSFFKHFLQFWTKI
ncbi:hypothetical protein [Helicobacter cinaedi]|uniref:hypothetical protein n=1 Tax=Helicobacter cinaedi TaxID=213 RepID=UPI001FB3BF5D|nr:hypothetical protein [Helicobacter cinaedi]